MLSTTASDSRHGRPGGRAGGAALPKRLTHRSIIATAVAGALIAGSLVAVGVGAQRALANSFAPEVTAAVAETDGKDFILAGEDLTVEVAVSNPDGGKQFNLGVTALLPNAVDIVDGGAFGMPTVFESGAVLPNSARQAPATAAECAASGLILASSLRPAGPANRCAVPEGFQLWVFSNVDDLPQGATVSSTIVVRPDASVYPVGSEIDFGVTAYTSDDPSRLPVFDGSPSRSETTTHNSQPGNDAGFDPVPVRALRVTKSEPSAEDELLRGVHANATTYTIRIEHTGQAATEAVRIVDYLPAGFEYLGAAGGDHSTLGEEYPGSGPIPGTWTPSGAPGETVETVEVDAATADELGLAGPGVYTRVTWTLAAPLAGGSAQALPDAAAQAGVTEFTYRAAVPLFENALWEGDAPSPESGAQAANLDNNTGPSTRHGGDDPADPQYAKSLRNTVSASGTYAGPVAGGDDAHRAVEDRDDESVDAVDVAVVKSVATDASGDAFAVGSLAEYSLAVRVSEYVDASDIVLTDTVPNGLCPAFPEREDGAPVALSITDGSGSVDFTDDPAGWSEALGDGACAYPSAEAGAEVTGAAVESIEYRAATGEFVVRFTIDAIAANGGATARYTLMQRANYAGDNGATSSGDRLVNTVDVQALTTPIPAIAEDPELLARTGDERYPLDDSSATIVSNYSGLTKTLLKRGVALADAAEADWEKTSSTPFSIGDRVWYRIQIPFARGIDTRNPILDDYLPEGVGFVSARYAFTGLPGFADVPESRPIARDAGDATFPADLIPDPIRVPSADPTQLTWEFGEHLEAGSADRFMPRDSSITVFLQGVVRAQSVSQADVDSPANHAKYQQVNVAGELSFHRESASGGLDWGAGLVKGIRTNPHPGGSSDRGFGAGGTDELVTQGDEVVFRLDVTAPQNLTSGYTVWDVLPAGVRAADIDPDAFTAALVDAGAETPIAGAGFTARALDPEDLPDGSPAPKPADRSIIVFEVSAEVPGSSAATASQPARTRGLTLGYTLRVPADEDGFAGGPAAQLGQSYENTAGIVSYEVPNNLTGEATTVVPQRPAGGGQVVSDRVPAPDEFGFDDAGTFDSAEIHLPEAAVEKRVVSTEVTPADDARNTSNPASAAADRRDDAVVPGELATFEYAVTIPARTSVNGAVLSDGGRLATGTGSVPYEFVDGSARFFGPDGAELTADCGAATGDDEFRCAQSRGSGSGTEYGVLQFPASYDNATDEPQTFRAQITVLVPASTTGLGTGPTALVNTATFAHDAPAGGTVTRQAKATTTHLTPAPTLTKAVVGSTTVSAGGEVRYRLTAGAATGRPALYDAVLLDCVPAEIAIVEGSLAPSRGTASVVDGERCSVANGAVVTGSGSGTLVEWRVGRLDAGSPATLEYAGRVTPQAGGAAAYTNTATLTGFSLPAEIAGEDTTDRRATSSVNSARTVRIAEANMVKAADRAAAPIGETIEYTMTAVLPQFANYYDLRIRDRLPQGVEFVGHTGWSIDWGGIPEDDQPIVTAHMPRGTVATGQILDWTLEPEDALSHDEPRSITLRFDVRVTDAVTAGAVTNTAALSWNRIDDTESSRVPDKQGSTTTTIQHPKLGIQKLVDGVDALRTHPDADLDYTLLVSNTGTSTAHHADVVDDVPAGLVVDPATISHGGILSADGRRITWSDLDPIATGAGAAVTLSYTAAFAGSAELDPAASAAGLGALLRNTASVTGYESFEDGGRSYVPGRNGVSPATDTAEAAPLFPRVDLRKEVVGSPLAHIGEPLTWRLTASSVGAGDVGSLTLTDELPPHWSYAPGTARVVVDGADRGQVEPVIGPDGSLAWELTSGTDAPLLAGTGAAGAATGGTAVITFQAVPEPDAATDAAGALVTSHVNTLSATATDRTGTSVPRFVGEDAEAEATLETADLGIVKSRVGGDDADPIRAGTEAAAWRIDVTNHGPNRAEGPITVSDLAEELPAGVEITGASGTGWRCDVPVRAADGTTAFDCARTAADEGLAVGASFPPITVAVRVAADQQPVDVENSARVTPGRTIDLVPDNDASTSSVPIDTEADLAIEKTSTTAEPTAGAAITWQLAPRNDGPSASFSTSAEPITITDTVPAGISNATFRESNAAWALVNPQPADGWQAGDTITWRYTGDSAPVGALPVILLGGVVDADWTGGEIANTATIAPGTTEDPRSPNDESTATVDPGDDTALGVAKTRVVRSGDAWVLAGAGDAVVWGEPVSYRITVTNHGPAVARAVTAVDEAPDGLSYRSHESESGSWTRTAGGTNAAGASDPRWDTFALAEPLGVGADAMRSFVVTYDTDPGIDATQGVVNWVEAGGENVPDPVRDPESEASDRIADLGIVKTHTGEATAGGTLDYALTVTNHGPSVADGVIEVSDLLPTGFSYVAGSGSVAVADAAAVPQEPTVDGRRLTWAALPEGQTLAPGAEIVVSLTAQVDAGIGPQLGLVNRATVDQPYDPEDPHRSTDPDPGNDSDDDPTDVVTSAIVTIEKEALGARGSWIAGAEAEYELTIVNEGPSEVPVRVRDVLPAGLTLASIDGADWDCADSVPGSTSGACVFVGNDGLLPVGAPSVIRVVADISASAPSGSAYENIATVTWTTTDGDPESSTPQRDEDTATILVDAEADLGIEKSVIAPEAGAPGIAGGSARYRLAVTNHGPSDAIGPITVTDRLPAGLEFDATTWADGSGWRLVHDAARPGEPSFVRDEVLASGAEAPPIEFDVRLDAGLAAGAAVVNTAAVSSPTFDPNPDNDTDAAELPVERSVDLSLEKRHDPGSVRVGAELPFELVATNHGPSVASGITVRDTVPAGLTVLSGAGAGDGSDAGSGSGSGSGSGASAGEGWTIDSVEPQADGTTLVTASRDAAEELTPGERTPVLTILTRVEPAAYPSVTNVAAVSAAEPDRDPANDEATDEVLVPALVTLVTEKTAVGDFQVGETGTYRITVENRGPTADPGPITVTDVLPAGLTFASSPDPGVAASGGIVTWTLPDGLDVGEEIGLTLVVNIGQAAYPQVVNTVTVDSTAETTPDSVLSDDAIAPVAAADPLALTGADGWALAILAALLLALGGAGILLRRRRVLAVGGPAPLA